MEEEGGPAEEAWCGEKEGPEGRSWCEVEEGKAWCDIAGADLGFRSEGGKVIAARDTPPSKGVWGSTVSSPIRVWGPLCNFRTF